MTRFIALTFFVATSMLVVARSNGLATGFTFEEEFQQLKQNYANLAAKFNQLELKLERQESIIASLQRDKQQTKWSDISDVNELINDDLAKAETVVIPRTCYELQLSNASLASGMYWIDPDGQDVGDQPIYVYCNMASGATAILHDSEAKIQVSNCLTPGCYSRMITYNASMRQMATLAELSGECHQYFQYDCVSAPFEFDGISYSWWNDRNGKEQYFWAGKDDSIHTCECGIYNSCVQILKECNCDSGLTTAQTDLGTITKADVLPVTKLNFGRVSGSGYHTLGRFECTGKFSGMPTSCYDLSKLGHTLSGFYSIRNNDTMETVFCDFTKPSADPGVQTWIGYTDVKSVPTYFYVQRSTDLTTINTTITWDVERTNVGGAMDLTSGAFTAPQSGVYFFSFSAVSYYPSNSGTGTNEFSLKLNGNEIGRTQFYVRPYSTAIFKGTSSLQSTLALKSGDVVWIEQVVATSAYLTDSSQHYTHFTGWLM